MVSYEVRYDGTFRAYNQIGEITKIGEGLSKNGVMDQKRIDDTLRELKVFSEINKMEKVHHVLAVATSAVREAGNRDEFISKAKTYAGIDFRTLSQEEEALFSYVGGAKGTNHPDLVFFDLGGGSLEIVYSKDYKIQKVLSLPIGALKMADQFNVRGKDTNAKDYQKFKEKVSSAIPDRKALGIKGKPVLIGVGGTLRALARFDQVNRSYPLYKMHNYQMGKKSLDEIHQVLLNTKVDRIAKINAFGKGRAQSVTAGSLVISNLMEKLGFDNITVSSHGLRDGILSEYLRDSSTYASREYSIETADKALRVNEESTQRREMVISMAQSGLISQWEKGILTEAIGSYLDLYLSTRPETLFYSVISQDSNLSHSDQIVEAIALVRAKAPRMSRWFQERYTTLLNKVDKKAINKMSYLIQLAELLYKSGSKVRIEQGDDSIRIEVKTGSRKTFPELLFKRIVEQLTDTTDIKVEADFI